MARLSASAKAKMGAEKARLEAELSHYQKLVRDLRTGSESPIVRTEKQKGYHRKIQELKQKLLLLSSR
ncbi:MAG: hypothetical protein NTU61_05035 [Candidatus Altiarchaeota archaeon]|nr:hypothetical protein [Candidatus Altiarchaeota archaeon]